jgi:carbon storage regulator
VLVISRKKNESIVINNDVILTVVEIRGDKVRLGVVAPREAPVHRKEVYDAIHGAWPAPTPRQLLPGEESFHRAILDHPNDISYRLVFADWLEEHGDPLGDFIRVQCRLAESFAGDPERSRLEEKKRALLAAHGASWKAALPEVLWNPTFDRAPPPRSHNPL